MMSARLNSPFPRDGPLQGLQTQQKIESMKLMRLSTPKNAVRGNGQADARNTGFGGSYQMKNIGKGQAAKPKPQLQVTSNPNY